jgi:(p)ppGpp synthase/HD superfamily hydrolase
MFEHGVERALQVALHAHEGQFRKGSRTPYVVHPIHVALMLTRLGADHEVVQAGLLHDVVEDSHDWDHDRVVGEFGVRVAALVAEVTEDKGRTWHERKWQAVEDVPRLSSEAVLLKAADKLHNLESLARALAEAEDKDEVWGRFRGGREQTLELSSHLVEALCPRIEDGLASALRAAFEAIRHA